MSSRRQFLLQATAFAMLSQLRAFAVPASPPSNTGPLSSSELRLLSAVIDEIIPESDDMPSASAAGALSYLQQLSWQYPGIASELGEFLRVVEHTSIAKFN